MRLTLLSTASAMVLLNATPAAADIGPGDLKQVIEDAWNDALDSLCAWLLEPAENLPELALPTPPPAPVDGHVEGEPLTIEQSQEYASQRVEDRTKRVEALDSAAKAALAASQQAGMTVQSMNAANMVPPVSVVAGQQIGNAIAAAVAGDQTAQTQLLAAQVSMQADQAQQQEQARAINQAQIKALYGDIQGGKVEATQFRSWW